MIRVNIKIFAVFLEQMEKTGEVVSIQMAKPGTTCQDAFRLFTG